MTQLHDMAPGSVSERVVITTEKRSVSAPPLTLMRKLQTAMTSPLSLLFSWLNKPCDQRHSSYSLGNEFLFYISIYWNFHSTLYFCSYLAKINLFLQNSFFLMNDISVRKLQTLSSLLTVNQISFFTILDF